MIFGRNYNALTVVRINHGEGHMNKIMPVLIALAFVPGYVNAEPVLDESTVKAISREMTGALMNNDVSVFKKYLYPGSKIVVDMDPANNTGQTEISYDEYMSLIEMAMPAMQNAEIFDELISISVDEARNQATIEEKTTAVVEMMGIRMKDVSINRTTYGVVDGRIKVLSSEDQLISIGPAE